MPHRNLTPKTWLTFTSLRKTSGYMFLALSSGGVVILLNMAWILLRFKRRDLDRDHDGSISTEEAMMFLFKNLGEIT
jgi:hypothetical protein